MTRWTVLVLAAATLGAGLLGCKGGGEYDPNYSREIKMTEQDKMAEQQLMQGQKMPANANEQPGTMPVPGKRGR